MKRLFSIFSGQTAVLAGIAAIIGGLLWLSLLAEREHAAKLQGQLTEVVAAHELTIARYAAAQASARAAAEAAARQTEAAVAAEQEKARVQFVALRADYDRRLGRWLHSPRTAEPRRDDRAADLPGTAAVPSGAVPPPGFAIVPVADLERSAAAFAQLDALISYVEGLGVAMSPAEAP